MIMISKILKSKILKFKISKKATVQHIFVYMLAIILIGLILLLGYRFLNDLLEQGCEVEMVNFYKDIEILSDRYAKYGSFSQEEIDAPCEFNKVCFVHAAKLGTTINTGDAIIDDAVKDENANIFLVSDEVRAIDVNEKIVTEGDFVCIDALGGVFHLMFEGLGKTVKISEIT